jgi:hypothetical protein
LTTTKRWRRKASKGRYDEGRSGNKISSSKVKQFNGGKARWKARNERWKKLEWADWAANSETSKDQKGSSRTRQRCRQGKWKQVY